jgi:hypothetical protein
MGRGGADEPVDEGEEEEEPVDEGEKDDEPVDGSLPLPPVLADPVPEAVLLPVVVLLPVLVVLLPPVDVEEDPVLACAAEPVLLACAAAAVDEAETAHVKAVKGPAEKVADCEKGLPLMVSVCVTTTLIVVVEAVVINELNDEAPAEPREPPFDALQAKVKPLVLPQETSPKNAYGGQLKNESPLSLSVTAVKGELGDVACTVIVHEMS